MSAFTAHVNPAVSNGDGSKTTPYNSVAAALAAFGSGADGTILLAAGYVYAQADATHGLWITGLSPANRLVIDYYVAASNPAPAMPPTFNGMQWLTSADDANWAHVSDGIWRKGYVGAGGVNTPLWRIWAGARLTGAAANNSLGTGYSLPETAALCKGYHHAVDATQAEIMASLSPSQPWGYGEDPLGSPPNGAVGSAGYLYMLTGSATIAPPSYFGGLAIAGSDNSTWGCTSALAMFNSSRVTLRNLAGIGGQNGASVTGNNDYGYIEAEDLQLIAPGVCGWISRCTASTKRGRGIVLRRVYIDGRSHIGEAWDRDPDVAQADGKLHDWLNNASTGFRVDYGIDGLAATDCEVRNQGTHAPIEITSWDHTSDRCTNVLFERPKIRMPAAKYGRAITFVGAGANCAVNRADVAEVTAYAHWLGPGKLTNSHFADCRPLYSNYVGPNGITGQGPAVYIFSSADYKTLAANDIVIEGNAFGDPIGWPFYAYQVGAAASGYSWDAGAIVVRNNGFSDYTYIAQRRHNSTADRGNGQTWAIQGVAGESIAAAITTTGNAFGNPYPLGNVVLTQYGGTFASVTVASLGGTNTEGNASSAAGGVHAGYQLGFDGRLQPNPPPAGV